MKCENCGNENVEILNARKGHYLCGKCGRDTESLYEREHDKEIRAKAVDEFVKAMKRKYPLAECGFGVINDTLHKNIDEIAKELQGE